MKEIKTMLLGIAFMIQGIFLLLLESLYIALISGTVGLIMVFIGYGKEATNEKVK